MRRPGRPRFLIAVSLILLTTVPIAAQEAPATPVSPFAGPMATPGGDLPGNPAIELVKVADGLTQPVNVTHAGDGSGRVFVVERVGRIRVIEDGKLLDQPFLDISGWVTREDVEQGLLGLAFDPDYATNGFFYVYYTDYWRNGQARVSRFQVSKDDPNHAEMNSVQPVLAVDEPYTTHNAGEMHFGPDGDLYIALGDGGFGFYPYEKATPSLNNLLGKILRIDVHATGDAAYTVPTDNPFVGQPGICPETWVYGLRNPWQFAFDRVTGDLSIGDVGANVWEEIDMLPAGSKGQNLGWDLIEGSGCYPEQQMTCDAVGVPPVAEYQHGEDGCAVTAIGVVRGTGTPSLDGVFVNSDFCTGKVWGLARGDGGSWQYQELLDTTLQATGGGEDEAGALYLTSCECSYDRDVDPFADPGGTLWRIVAAGQVPSGASVAPPEPVAEPAATPSP